MDIIDTNVADSNSIAYNGPLREQLKALHELVGLEVTDIASNALQSGIKFSEEADRALLSMSNITSKLTLALLNAKSSKKNLTHDEEQDVERVKSLTVALGNLQDKVNRVIKYSKQVNELNVKMKEAAIALTEETMVTQQKFREVRSAFNDYGLLSDNPDLAFFLGAEERKEDAR